MISSAEFRAELEEDLAWRLEELLHLRRELLSEPDMAKWSTASMRTILVMQYAHLEGFVRNTMALYVQIINEGGHVASSLKAELIASALAKEFRTLRQGIEDGSGTGPQATSDASEAGRLTRRAQREVQFVHRVRDFERSAIRIDADEAVSMEMNLGSDVLKRSFYALCVAESGLDSTYYRTLEFIRKTRNDVAHGSRTQRIPPGLFEAHRKKSELFMGELQRLMTRAVREEWYLKPVAAS